MQAAEAACIRAPELTVTLRMTVRDSATHTCRLIFKLAVEVDMLMHVLASGMEIDRQCWINCAGDVSKS